MRLRKNRITERAGVNATRTFFEANGSVWQDIDLGNDYGKDAYVDLGVDGAVTGVCIALQIKSGPSFRRADGYAIPVEGHEAVWRDSTVPIVGVVFDPDDGNLYWCDISEFLDRTPRDVPATIPVPRKNVLQRDAMSPEFFKRFAAHGRRHPGRALLKLQAADPEDQEAAIYDCFAAGRSDPRVMIALRYMLPLLQGEVAAIAIDLLAHATPHPDILWGRGNWVTDAAQSEIAKHFRWTTEDVYLILQHSPWEDWHRGGYGQSAYMLLCADWPAVRRRVYTALRRAVRAGEDEIAWTAFYLLVFWADRKGIKKYEQLVDKMPSLQSLELSSEMRHLLAEDGYLPLF